MKKSLLPVVAVILILTACNKADSVFFKIGSGFEYRFHDIELYDSSTHMLYFKDVHDEFKNMEKNSFVFLDNGDVIYSGTFWPGYSSSVPTGPFIYAPPMFYGGYALRIDNWSPQKPDVRNDPRIISVLKQNNLLHSGLSISSSSIEIAGTQLTFRFTVTNKDQSDILILDINKTGPNLFHFFTNGLIIYDGSNNEVFSSNIQHQTPNPWNSWTIDWLSVLKSGTSKDFTINYTIQTPLTPGEYRATFEFPGLAYQITKDQLYQNGNRIWLGDVSINKKITL